MNELSLLIKKRVSETLSHLSFPRKDFSLMPTKNLQFGDLSTNIALVISKDLKKKPMEIGQKILDSLSKKFFHGY
jgi:arginyl-tRNA synthetase